MKKKRIYIIIVLVFILGVVYSAFHKWAVDHATYMTGGVAHPIGCISCHVAPEREGFLANMMNEEYLSPINGTVSSDGKKLYVVSQDADLLLEIDLSTDQISAKIPVGRRPHSVVLLPGQQKAIVSNQWANNIYFIDLTNQQITDTIATGAGPAGMSLSNDGKLLYIADTYSNNVSIIDIDGKQEIRRLQGGNFPTNVAVSPLSDVVYVSSQRTSYVGLRSEVKTELTVINAETNKVDNRQYFSSAHIMENVAFAPEGDLALTTLVRPKNLVPSSQIEQGWMMNHGIGVIMQGGRMAQLLLDEPNQFYPDPYDVVIAPNGQFAYVSHSGANVVSVIDMTLLRALLHNASEEDLKRFANKLGLCDTFVVARVKTGSNPKGLVMSPDGKFVFVMERMNDNVAVIDTEKNEVVRNISLGGPSRITYSRKGGQLFTNAGHTFHNQYSCYTCHPDGHEDGLVYDLTGSGRNFANVQTLRDLKGTAPFKWIGTNESVYKQCGMRFSIFVTRTESFNPENLDALVAYILRELTHPPNFNMQPNGELTEAQKRGKAFFERTITNDKREIPVKDRCTTCHPAPSFSNLKMADIGSLKSYDDPTLFDAPNLNNIYEAAPYLHDGSAKTLEEIWTVYNPNDTHGYVNDMTKDQLNDLIEYLKAIPSEEYLNKNFEYTVNKGQL